MSPEEKIEAAQKLINEARAEFAAKKRSWPETIEAGMVFRWAKGYTYIYARGGCLVNIATGETFEGDQGFRGKRDQFTYLGHARDILTIALPPQVIEAHEPTGAELVGKVCEYCDIDGEWDDWGKGECKDFTPGTDQPYLRNQGGRFRFARLAR